ncbi:MAG: DUF6259 domain-containing protein [Thermoguttaceae bacterium]
MKRLLFLVLLGLVSCRAAIAADVQDGVVVVENAHLRLVFAANPVPSLRQLVHKPSGTELLVPSAAQSLFAVDITERDGARSSLESQAARRGSIEVTPVDGGQQIRLEFAGLGPSGDMAVQIDGRLDDAEPLVRWSIAVDNPGRRQLTAVRFPYLAAVPAIGAPGDDFLVAPAFPGAIVERPSEQWPASYSMASTFPGDQSVQFFSYQDQTAGVYLASMDTAGWGRTLRVSKRNDERYVLSHEYVLPDGINDRWQSPYEVATGVTSGTWQHTADLYKRWAQRQSWCARRLSQRDDIPELWKRGPCVHTVEVRTYGRDRLCSGSYYAELPEHLRRLRERIDGPVIPMLAGWENHRRWTAGDYFPLFDEAIAAPALQTLRADGFPPFVFLSGLCYTFENEGRDGGPVPGADRYLDAFVIDKATGKPKVGTLNESSGQNTWKRHSYSFCPAAPATKEFFRSVIDRLHASGIDIVQMDQTTSGAGDVCYSTAHGHPPGPGLYRATAFRQLLRDLHDYGRSLSPDFLLFHEEPHEELIPCLDGFHTRQYKERYWYRGGPGVRGIPLFTYLYHEYAIAYGGDSAGVSKAKNENLVRQHAVNLVTGTTPGVAIWSDHQAASEAHPDQLKMVRNHSRLLGTEVQRFLMLGRMLHAMELDVPMVEIPIPVQRDGTWRNEPFAEQAVLTSSWQSPEGLVGHCLVNITDRKQGVQLHLDTSSAPGWPKADIDLYRAEAPEKHESIGRDVTLPFEQTLELAPLEAVFFVMRPTK